MQPNKLIPVCKLYENTSKTTGRRYFTGNLSFTSKVLILPNDNAKEGDPPWTLFLAEREAKPPQGPHFGDSPARRKAA